MPVERDTYCYHSRFASAATQQFSLTRLKLHIAAEFVLCKKLVYRREYLRLESQSYAYACRTHVSGSQAFPELGRRGTLVLVHRDELVQQVTSCLLNRPQAVFVCRRKKRRPLSIAGINNASRHYDGRDIASALAPATGYLLFPQRSSHVRPATSPFRREEVGLPSSISGGMRFRLYKVTRCDLCAALLTGGGQGLWTPGSTPCFRSNLRAI